MNLTSREQELVAAGGILGGVFALSLLVALVVYVLFIIAWWKIFEKAGMKGWKSIIPIYNQYCLYRISGMSGWWCLAPIVPSFLLALCGVDLTGTHPNITEAQFNNPLIWLSLLMVAVLVVVEIIQIVKLAKNFGKGTGFKIASIFFPNITSLILAFGSAKFDKKALHD